ncbi:MAG: histidine ammonia-lyase [Bacteroidales bacterium]
MIPIHSITTGLLNFEDINQIIIQDKKLELSEEVSEKINRCRAYLDQKMESNTEPIYGINTGFGALYDKTIPNDELSTLQRNLVMSHACGTGDEVPLEVVKLMLLLKVQSLAYGHSGVQLLTVQRLVDFYNHHVIPVVYQLGSLGASGDLAPLAHLSLPILGLGEVYYQGEKRDAGEVLTELNWQPVALKSKAGLALLNGTQFMSAYGVYCCLRIFKLSRLADIIGAISLDAFDGRIEPFHPLIQSVRPHKGQIKTAFRINNLLEGSEIISRKKKHVQDPYSFRCIPQVHGASKDSINYVAYVFRKEINSVTDNPTIFPDQDLIISAGNFHGQPLALALDNLSIAMAELGNISERRTYQLLSGARGLPPFLVANPGLNSGFMIPQYTAASIVNQNKILCTPASVDSIESSKGQEDHVSMGANAATKAYRIMENLERILAIELYTAAQALEFRRSLKTSPVLEDFITQYRRHVAFVREDQVMYQDIQASVDFLKNIEPVLPGEDTGKFQL